MCFSPKIIPVKKTFLVNELYSNRCYQNSYDKLEINLPCGKCDDCKVSHSKEWALRSMLEFVSLSDSERKKCWFLTLTYDEKHFPSNGKLDPKCVSLFIKKLRHYFERKDKNVKLKYFVCGEYGTKNYRPHYHMLIYGLLLTDLNLYKCNSFNDLLFTSQFLKKMWGNGFVVVGVLNFKTAFYTARYSLKKLGDTDCFIRCSHGFGKKWCLDNIKELIDKCFVRFAGFNYSVPRYFCKLIRKYFNNDFKYVDWCKKRKNLAIDKLNVKSKIFNTNELFLFDDNFRNNFIKNGKLFHVDESETVKIDLYNRKVIKQALFDLFKNRENFI